MKQATLILFICLCFLSARSQVTESSSPVTKPDTQTRDQNGNAETNDDSKIPLRNISFDKNPPAFIARIIELNNHGAELFSGKKFGEAAAFFRLAVEIAPQLIQPKLNLANALLNQKNYAEAEEICRKLIGEKVEDASLYAILGSARYESGDYAESVIFYQKAIALDKQNPAIYNDLGNAFFYLKEYRAAQKAFETALEMQPLFPDALNNYGATLIENKQYNEAVEKLRRAIEQRPDFAEAHNNLGMAYFYLGKKRSGRKSFLEAVRLDPKSASAQFHLGLSYLLDGDRKKAEQCLEVLKKLDADLAQSFQKEFYKKYIVNASEAK